MRSILTLTAAVAVLSISQPATAQSHVRIGDLQGEMPEAQVLSPSIPAPVQPRAMPVTRTNVSQTGIKDCSDFRAARGGWVSPTCTGAELTLYLSAKGIQMAPAGGMTTTYTSVSPEEQARRDRLNFDADLRERQADRDAERANRCANRDLGRQVLGSLAGAAINAASSRVNRGGYYGGGYYQTGSTCVQYYRM